MPNPNERQSFNSAKVASFEEHLKSRFLSPEPNKNTDEIALLRKEIAELRQLMTPSIILTGQRAIDAYWELTKS